MLAGDGDGDAYYESGRRRGRVQLRHAAFSGSMDGQPLNKPIAGMATTRKGNGYYELASDGGMFSFPTGAAGQPFYGSSGSMKLNKPVIGISVHRGGGGYYLGAADGGIFSYGAASF
ncbi:MAG TPA: hypothetical protein VHY81_02715 [Acidimicrobiales bacterium]|nr:hypothetical protein [Acidimicrobiales bacterium]